MSSRRSSILWVSNASSATNAVTCRCKTPGLLIYALPSANHAIGPRHLDGGVVGWLVVIPESGVLEVGTKHPATLRPGGPSIFVKNLV